MNNEINFVDKQLFIEDSATGVKTAITENGKLTDLYIDISGGESWVGRVILGRIKTILPGGFAFLDIGSKVNAFMNIKSGHGFKAGQPILVQVLRDASGTKGMYVGTELSLRGRFIILHRSNSGIIGISRKITDSREGTRLKNLVRELIPRGFGCIVRTNAVGSTQTELASEIEMLHDLHMQIRLRSKYIMPPSTLYPSAATETKLLLVDILSEEFSEIHISANENIFSELKESIINLIPNLKKRVFKYQDDDMGLFDKFSISTAIRHATDRAVKLPCGGFITFDETEACVVIDVNTGSNIGSYGYAETVFRTNINAADAVVYQIRLRNLSGIILIDFIDMASDDYKRILLTKLRNSVKFDRVKVEVVGMIGLGMVQLTRKKTRSPLSSILEQPCPTCSGKGRVRIADR